MTVEGTSRPPSASLLRRRWRTESLRIQRLRSPFRLMTLLVLLSLVVVISAWGQGNAAVEYQVKAAFLFNFAKFVEWPSDTVQGEKTPITLCVFRHDPFGAALDEIIRGKIINNRAVLSRRINEFSDLKSCQLVFISSVEDKHLGEVIASLKGTSALLVGEGQDFAERGGGIQLFQEDGKLRFAINVDSIQRARLTVSSKLLALAKIVHDQGNTKGN
jgi:YfiR/HmsC-like